LLNNHLLCITNTLIPEELLEEMLEIFVYFNFKLTQPQNRHSMNE